MAVVARLLTFVEVDDEGGDARVSVSTRHEAVLSDGRRAVLLNDRGWSSSGTWADHTVDDMERTSRFVVGPDEAFEDRTQADMDTLHWDELARVLQEQGVEVEAAELKLLPHDVELSDRVLARVGRGGSGPG